METDSTDGVKLTSNEALRQLNEKLGITDRDSLFSEYEVKSVEEMLEKSRHEFEEFSKAISDKKNSVETATDNLKTALAANENPLTSSEETKSNAIVAITTFKESIDAMSNLIRVGEDIMMGLVMNIKMSPTVDPDLVSSTANIIEGIRISIADIINYNTEKMKLEHQYRLAMDSERLKQRHRLELEYFKSELRMKEAKQKAEMKKAEENSKAIDVSDEAASDGKGMSWSQIDVINAIRKTSETISS